MRTAATLFFAAAIATLAWDVLQAASSPAGFRLHGIDALWFAIDRTSFQLLQPAIERHIDPNIWFDWVFPVLQTPAAAAFAGTGLVFYTFSRRSAA